MQILLTAATPYEIAPVVQWLVANCSRNENGIFTIGDLAVFPLITGVGTTATAFHLGRFFAHNRPDLAVNAGIAGAIDRRFQLGEVLNIVTERFGDLGVELADGRFSDLFDLGLADKNDAPFINGLLRNPAAEQASFLPVAHGITVNKAHGAEVSISAMQALYPDAQVESMEGAAFFYACLSSNVPFLEIRSISNYVEPRNREKWNLPLAIDNLNQTLVAMLQTFCSEQT